MDEILLIGGGGHAASVLEVIEELGRFKAVGIVDPAIEKGGELQGLPVLGSDEVLEEWVTKVKYAFLGVGSVRAGGRRRELFEKALACGFQLPVLIHGSAVVARDVQIGEGTVLMPGAVVRTGSVIGRNVILNSGSIVDHHNRIGDHSHVATGASLAGTVVVGEDSLVGAGATILQGRTVGNGVTVGAGAVVTRDVADGDLVVGAPARPVGG